MRGTARSLHIINFCRNVRCTFSSELQLKALSKQLRIAFGKGFKEENGTSREIQQDTAFGATKGMDSLNDLTLSRITQTTNQTDVVNSRNNPSVK